MNALLFTCCALLIAVHGMPYMENRTSQRDKKDIATEALHSYNLMHKTKRFWKTVYVLEEKLPLGDRLVAIFAEETECRTKKKLLTRDEVNSPICPLLQGGKTYVCFVYYDEQNNDFDKEETSCKEKNYQEEQARIMAPSGIDKMKKKKKGLPLCGLNRAYCKK
ncbi:hypothetical protein M514_01705 [Trichuris suis]|uniref:Cystatin domain-containing protein n=1 Tax=Trichuris suis TaxID=68888 RepID=A0A085NSC4_9BILA|nr:hypothetical protein M513_01705 [Trichuris suis]KFD72370.1 hypothetical protein M514_01705 [Trichuris suis]KHJ49258.1 hypothetical protein D918_00381 [Trichuris suis]